jgi:hypothetical protein
MTENNLILGPSSSPSTGQLTAALAAAQAEYQHVALDAANPHFKSRFSSYATCCDSLRGPLTKNGLSLPDFRPGLLSNGQWVMVGTLRHKSGEYITGIAPLLMGKNDMQSFGSACTYAKRTLLMALCGGFSGEPDDDGEENRQQAQETPRARAVVATQKTAAAMQREGEWKKRIAEASDDAAARKVMAEVELRLRERAIDRGVFDRCRAEYRRLWTKEEVTNG